MCLQLHPLYNMCLTSCGGKHTVERFAVNIKKKVGTKEALQRLQNLEKWVMPIMETYYLLISDLCHTF